MAAKVHGPRGPLEQLVAPAPSPPVLLSKLPFCIFPTASRTPDLGVGGFTGLRPHAPTLGEIAFDGCLRRQGGAIPLLRGQMFTSESPSERSWRRHGPLRYVSQGFPHAGPGVGGLSSVGGWGRSNRSSWAASAYAPRRPLLDGGPVAAGGLVRRWISSGLVLTWPGHERWRGVFCDCLLYTSDAADE